MTLSSIMSFLENMKQELKQDSTDLRRDMITFQTDVSSKIDDVFITMDTTLASARSDWTAAIAASTAPLDLRISDAISTLTATVDTFTTFSTTLDHTTTTVASLETNVTSLREKVEAIQPPLSPSEIRQILNDKWESDLDGPMTILYNLKDTVDTRLAELDSARPTSVTSSSTSRHLIPCITGFHQAESKDFNASKLHLGLKDIILSGDSLKELELFWDSILRVITNLCQNNQSYPYYCDLKKDFTFWNHLVGDLHQPNIPSSDYEQAKRNYRSFGDVLRIFLHTPSTIAEANCPQAHLQLISLCDTRDGFLLLQTLLFNCSPQLNGRYRNFRHDIGKLTIVPGEHLSKFYQRTMQPSTEINLSGTTDGSSTELSYKFLSLLRATGCPTIQGVTNTYRTTITKHRRDPKHFIAPIPFTLKQVYDDLDNSEIGVLSIPSLSTSFTDNNDIPSPYATYSGTRPHHRSSSSGSSTNPSRHKQHHGSTHPTTSIGIHRTRDGRRFITNGTPSSQSSRIACDLCFNKHVNPWHSTDDCPLQHPTFILDKDIRERVMQYTALHGIEKKGFTKDQDIPRSTQGPPLHATGRRVTILEDPSTNKVTDDPLDSSSPITSTSDDTTLIQLEEGTHLHDGAEIIDSTYFEVPVPPIANTGHLPTEHLQLDDIAPGELINDHQQYLTYNS
jgi:hypothetical protein